ncbi:S8 family serine peptidase [Actinomadura atramentaria]|uniref:S8 family serine peptidase n=1 Tax=Actinomadura atramentaria TaxID=1990 RepID=UPI00036D0197|nr:S8 family serine peptidase [Actinomadura atramentaria]
MLRRVGAVLAAGALAVVPVGPAPARADQVRAAMAPVLAALDVPRAWELSRGAGVTVAVLDSGVDENQADLAGSVEQGPDYTAGANPPGVLPRRVHGTSMASIIAGHGHGIGGADGVLGVAPQARLLAVRVILERDEPGFAEFTRDPRFEGAIASGIRYAVDHGADVINLSLGRSYPTKAERAAVAYALARDVVVVAAAGNSGADPAAPGAKAADGGGFTYPASFPGVISVAAVDSAGRHAGFSNKNTAVAVSAPGVQIIGAGPGGQYWIGDGTSPATAFVSGIAALIRARHPGLAPALVEQALTTGAQHRPARGYDASVGFGRVDARAALAAADALAGNRDAGLGLDPARRFADGRARPVEVVHRSGAVVAATSAGCVLAAVVMFAAVQDLLRRRRLR